MIFTEPVSLSLLTQGRTQGPYGLNGGQAGQPGEQYLVKRNGEEKELASVTQQELEVSDRLIMKTPGGGGWGKLT